MVAIVATGAAVFFVMAGLTDSALFFVVDDLEGIVVLDAAAGACFLRKGRGIGSSIRSFLADQLGGRG